MEWDWRDETKRRKKSSKGVETTEGIGKKERTKYRNSNVEEKVFYL